MRVATAFAVMLIAVAVSANPIAFDLYVDFDPPNGVMSVYPPPSTAVNAYIVSDLSYLTSDPIYSISFDIEVPAGSAQMASFVPTVPSFIVTGIVGDGITVFNEDCFEGGTVVLGHIPILYTGVPGTVQIVAHPYQGHVFLTCPDYDEYTYCITMGGGLGMEPTAPLDLCLSPVENVQWGVIKALYR